MKNLWCIEIPCYVPEGRLLNESPTELDNETLKSKNEEFQLKSGKTNSKAIYQYFMQFC